MRILNNEIEKRLRESIHSVELECGKMTEEEIEDFKRCIRKKRFFNK